MLVSRRRFGTCAALRWDATRSHYRCGFIVAPSAVLGLGRGGAARVIGRLVSRLAVRWIAAGKACDSDAAALPGPG